MRRCRLVLLASVTALVARTAPAMAQGKLLQGTVVSAVGGEGIEAVEVRLLSTGGATISGSDGRFRLRVPAHGVIVQLRRVGFLPTTIRLDSLPAGVVRLVLQPAATEVAGLTVLGEGAGGLARLPGSGAVISPEVIAEVRPFSASELLRALPGVHIQEEEGAGFRANIGVRGLDPDRSRTLLVLEDGIPVALNPYGEPELYYTPPIDRMARVELLKGSGSILHGPQTIGGVLNFVTPDPPTTPGWRAAVAGGSGGFQRGQLQAGGRSRNAGIIGLASYRRAEDLRGLHFEQLDLLLKASLQLGERDAIGLKVGVYDESSNSTYVGLTDSLFRASPLGYPGREDLLQVRRVTASISHQRALGRVATWRNVAYAFTTVRDWSRQNYGYNISRNALLFTQGTGNRNRRFEVGGIESRLRAETSVGTFEGGVRGHVESARDQFLAGTSATARSGALRDDEARRGAALALFGQQQVNATSQLRITPGVRVEHFRFERHILRMRVARASPAGTTNLPEDVDIRSDDGMTVVIPGLGASWFGGPAWTLFAGVHRGFAPPRTKDAFVQPEGPLPPGASVSDPVSLQLDAERSWNMEVGLRARPTTHVSLEVTVFRLDFTNQIITPSLSSGNAAQAALANQGATRHQGVEASVSIDGVRVAALPVRLGAQVTIVDARFSRDRLLARMGDTVNVRGHRLPYAPARTLAAHAALGAADGRGLRVDWTYVAEQFSDNFQTRAGSADGRLGTIPSQQVWNVTASARIPGTRGVVVGSVKNLFDRTYIASRRPEGIKPGMPRTIQVGIEY